MVTIAEPPTVEEAVEASKPHVWLRDAFFHGRGKNFPGCVPFTCIPPELAAEAKLEPGVLSDATIVYAHKFPLAARSEAMNFMLNVNKLDHVVVHCRSTVFEAFLQFIYTETLPKGIPALYTIEELLYVAETYQFHTAERQLASVVCKTMTASTVVEVLLKAVALNSLHLQRICAAFVSAHQTVVARSTKFRTLRSKKKPSDVERRAVEIICDSVFHGKFPLPPAPPYAVDYDPEEMTNAEIDEPSECSLAADLARACAANVGADVQLVSSKDDMAVWCSEWLISIRSPQFAESITKGKIGDEEEERSRVVFDDISSEALQALVLYLYSGELSAPTDVLVEMVSLASKTGLDDLFAELRHVPVATVTAANAVSVLIAMKRRGFAKENADAQKVVEACYEKVLRGWHIAAPALAELLESDLMLFLRTLNGAFSDSGIDDRIDERIALMHWKVMTDENIVKKLLTDYVLSGGEMALESTPLACIDKDQMKVALRVLDFSDDLGTKLLSEHIAHSMLEMLKTCQVFDFLRLCVDSDKIGTGGGRDALLIKLLPSIATLPSISSVLNHNQAMHLLRHVRVSNPFPGKDSLERRLCSIGKRHAGEISDDVYRHLPFELQMRILGERMENGNDDDDANRFGRAGLVYALEDSGP
eukprot:g2391.t1